MKSQIKNNGLLVLLVLSIFSSCSRGIQNVHSNVSHKNCKSAQHSEENAQIIAAPMSLTASSSDKNIALTKEAVKSIEIENSKLIAKDYTDPIELKKINNFQENVFVDTVSNGAEKIVVRPSDMRKEARAKKSSRNQGLFITAFVTGILSTYSLILSAVFISSDRVLIFPFSSVAMGLGALSIVFGSFSLNKENLKSKGLGLVGFILGVIAAYAGTILLLLATIPKK